MWASTVHYVNRTAGAGILATLIALAMFGTSMLQSYDDNAYCKIGGLDTSSPDSDTYKLTAQLIFVISLVVSYMIMPASVNKPKRLFISLVLSHGLVVTAFMVGYAGMTTVCLPGVDKFSELTGSSQSFLQTEINKIDFDAAVHLCHYKTEKGQSHAFNQDVLTDAQKQQVENKLNAVGYKFNESTDNSYIGLCKNDSVNPVAICFLVLSILIAIMGHDIYENKEDSRFHMALSHWPAFLDNIIRIIAFAMTVNFLNNNSNFIDHTTTSTNDIRAFCHAEFDGMKKEWFGDFIPYDNNTMKNIALAAVILTAVEFIGRVFEQYYNMKDFSDRMVVMTAAFVRMLSMASRLFIGLTIMGFLITNELTWCPPFDTTTEFRVTVGFLLVTFFSSILYEMLVGAGNVLVFFDNERHSKELMNTAESTKSYFAVENPSYAPLLFRW